MSTAVQPSSGTYSAQPVVSTVAFAVRHSGVFRYRGLLADVTATLGCDGDALRWRDPHAWTHSLWSAQRF
jgi:hypothetical protein